MRGTHSATILKSWWRVLGSFQPFSQKLDKEYSLYYRTYYVAAAIKQLSLQMRSKLCFSNTTFMKFRRAFPLLTFNNKTRLYLWKVVVWHSAVRCFLYCSRKVSMPKSIKLERKWATRSYHEIHIFEVHMTPSLLKCEAFIF